MTIENDLIYLKETKNLIKQAIISKGQEISDTDTFRSYVSKIDNISGSDTTTVNGSTLLNSMFNSTEPYEFIISEDVSSLPAKRYNSNEMLLCSVFSFTPVSAIYVPTTCTSLSAYCFATCPILEKVWIPSTTTVDYNLFGEIANENTVHVYTDATETTWDSAIVDSWQTNLAQGYVEVHFNMTYEDYVNKTIPEVATTATIKFVKSSNGSCIDSLSVTTTPDGFERTTDVDIAASESEAESIEVSVNSVITLEPSSGILPDTCKIYTDSALTNLIYEEDIADSYLVDFSYTVTNSVTFYIDAQFSGSPTII